MGSWSSTRCDEMADATEAECAAARARLLAQGLKADFLIRPVLLAEVMRAREDARRAAARPGEATPSVVPVVVSQPSRERSGAKRPPPPTLGNVVRADLQDVGRTPALYRQAVQRGWRQPSAVRRQQVVALAVHALRVGRTPCRLFVALLKRQAWRVITQAEDDRAQALLQMYDARRGAPGLWPGGPEAPGLSDDARWVLLAAQVLRQAGWTGDPWTAVQRHYPAWTAARWAQAQEELAAWRRQQARVGQPVPR